MQAWDGSPLNGRRILLHCEQGFGDTIQFARFVPKVAEMGGKVVLATHGELERLLRGSFNVDRVVKLGEPVSNIDVHCAIPSLPLLLHCDVEGTARMPYLAVDSVVRAEWERKLGSSDSRLRVGLAWAGNPRPDPWRSIAPELLLPLIETSRVEFHSLQKSTPPPRTGGSDCAKIIDHSADLADFADTAALVSHFDLIISIDTSVAHLAGALGKPVWVLLPYSPDWRWLLHRGDSPWYPTMRLFRQRTHGNWREVLERVSDSLGSLLADREN
jgi:hypothetical protein